ncbi:MAG: biopolymer transporter ExbD [Bdellovibrionaceae bacterium]|nr:biopolymer transporter ExbD [Bdellovibrionales bacterium]MCB9084644.1 biopolymer transporter ExbD [Pseudobdellovibrionaceae bacterium]
MAKQKKELDFEINLIAFISLLSVLICALLLTAIWVQIGTMNVKQAVGGQSQEETTKVPAIWAKMGPNGSITFRLQDAPKVSRKLAVKEVAGINNEVDLDGIAAHLEAVKKAVPELRTVLIQPKGDSMYEQIITLMDHFKKVGMVDLGVAPL